jgi:hypothetical protein
LINKELPCVSKEPGFSKRKKFDFFDWIHERNPQIYPQKRAGISREEQGLSNSDS